MIANHCLVHGMGLPDPKLLQDAPIDSCPGLLWGHTLKLPTEGGYVATGEVSVGGGIRYCRINNSLGQSICDEFVREMVVTAVGSSYGQEVDIKGVIDTLSATQVSERRGSIAGKRLAISLFLIFFESLMLHFNANVQMLNTISIRIIIMVDQPCAIGSIGIFQYVRESSICTCPWDKSRTGNYLDLAEVGSPRMSPHRRLFMEPASFYSTSNVLAMAYPTFYQVIGV